MSPLKVLVCAYDCNPARGSEAGVGWGWVKAIAQSHEVWVLTAEHHRPDIEGELRNRPDCCDNLHFVYVPRRRWLAAEKVWPPAYLWTYRIWQRSAFNVARELHRRTPFNLVHVITYVGFRVPGPFFQLGIPFVWGPVGGLENTSWRFLPRLGLRGAIHYAGRNLVNTVHKIFLPEPKHAFRAARGGIIAATSTIQREIRRWYDEDSVVICEVGVPPAAVGEHSRRNPDQPLRLCWSGLHLPGKALPLLLDALARLPRRIRWRLEILGAGPCTAKWHRYSRRIGIDANCLWRGQVQRSEALRVMQESHVFAITSVKDLTSTVLVEALAQGLPVVCPDHCGFADAIDESCGVKLAVGTPRQFIAALAEALERLHDDETLRSKLAAGAVVRARAFSWEHKAEKLAAIYAAKVGASAPESATRRAAVAHDGATVGA